MPLGYHFPESKANNPHFKRLAVLNSNSLASLSSLLPLANCQKLEHLSLVGNPVRSEKHYREWLIWKVSRYEL
jgi:U2 small nuclear ribonucleoprotein A'